MKCNHCGSAIPPVADFCPACRTAVVESIPPPLPPVPPPFHVVAQAKKDISWLVLALVCVPGLLISYAIAAHQVVADSAKMIGYAASPAIMALVIAGLLSGLLKARFRLALAIAFPLVVVLELASLLPQVPAESTAAAAPQSPLGSLQPLPTESARLTISWPAGWTVFPAKWSPEDNTVMQYAMLSENGERRAVLMAAWGNDGRNRTLAEEAKIIIESSREELTKNGGSVSWVSDPAANRLGDLDALEWESSQKLANGVSMLSVVVSAKMPNGSSCSLMFISSSDQYQKYKPVFDQLKNSSVCPGQG